MKDKYAAIRHLILKSANKKVIYTLHASEEMNKVDEMIAIDEVRSVVFHGKIIEDYPRDKRGHSCLMLGTPNDRPVHVVCAPKDEYLAIITAYIPSKIKWKDDFRTRR